MVSRKNTISRIDKQFVLRDIKQEVEFLMRDIRNRQELFPVLTEIETDRLVILLDNVRSEIDSYER